MTEWDSEKPYGRFVRVKDTVINLGGTAHMRPIYWGAFLFYKRRGKMTKPVIFSGIQPTGNLTIGNYLGALKNWVKLQEEYDTFYCIVDLHAITVRQVPKDLRHSTLQTLAIYMAAGLDPEKNTIFIQSHVPAHSELSWLLTCNTYMGELGRMTQYKDKSAKQGANIGAGLFVYPVLMAADILLYQGELVPVGQDQLQHIELARDIAIRFNNAYSDTFKVPKGYTSKETAKIYDLQDPSKKMSKSAENISGTIFIMDPEAVIRKKVSRAVTDSIGVISYSDEQPGVKNLINIYCAFRHVGVDVALDFFSGKSYKELKDEVANAIVDELIPLQDRVKELMDDKTELERIYREGADKAERVAFKTLRKVKKKIGFIPR